MTNSTLAGVLLLTVPVAFNSVFFMLQRAFEYPDILRRPPGYVLGRFKEGGSRLVRLWYAFALTAVLFIPVPVLVHEAFGAGAPAFLAVGTVFGVLAGLVQFLGLIRWSFLVPTLAEIHTAPGSTPAAREGAVVTFEAFNRYAGAAIGEHAGYLFTSVWTLAVCAAMIRTGDISPLLGWIGLVPAAGVLVGVLEETGVKAAAAVNAVSYVLLSLWLVALGIVLLLR
ncbi:MAG: DUF4386 domain-containing protein [Vicinamibacteria bacterium]|nr:DUF4386 domain-containing protein [Vicinamibacteria bacterium]